MQAHLGRRNNRVIGTRGKCSGGGRHQMAGWVGGGKRQKVRPSRRRQERDTGKTQRRVEENRGTAAAAATKEEGRSTRERTGGQEDMRMPIHNFSVASALAVHASGWTGAG